MILATGRGWRIRSEKGKRREGGFRHGYTQTQIATRNWYLPDNWLADWLAAGSATTHNNSTTHADPCWHKNLAWLIDILEINTVSRSCLPGFLSFGHSKRHSCVLIGQEREAEITKRGRESSGVKFSLSQLNILSDSEWRTQESSFTPLRWGQYAYLDLSQSAVPNIGALISWPNLEILSSNLIYPSWNGLF